MITPGEVANVRELKRGVQAEVCLGASVTKGSAVTVITTTDPEVMAALAALKKALRGVARSLTADILKDQREWDDEKAG